MPDRNVTSHDQTLQDKLPKQCSVSYIRLFHKRVLQKWLHRPVHYYYAPLGRSIITDGAGHVPHRHGFSKTTELWR